jgi:ankyrin repeat protein
MAEGTFLLQGDVLIITFSHTNRIKLYYYHHDTDFKEVKNLPIVKNIAQLQPIIFQFIEDFLRSRIEIAFEKPTVIFNPEKLSGNILLVVDSSLTESMKKEVEDFYHWLVETLRINEFHKIFAEKSIRNKETNKSEKIIETLFSDYHLSISLVDTLEPEAFKEEKLEKLGFNDTRKNVFAQLISEEILQKAGTITKISKENLFKEALKISNSYIDSPEKEWKGELILANKSFSFLLSPEKLQRAVIEQEKNIKANKAILQLVNPYNDINNLFSLLNNRKLSAPLFKEAIVEAFGNFAAENLIDFLNLGEKISPKESSPINSKYLPVRGLGSLDVLEIDDDQLSALDHLIEGKIKPKEDKTLKQKPNKKWLIFSGIFILLLTAVFAIPTFISPPVNCSHSLLLEMIKGNTHQVKRMVLACTDFRNPEQQVITINNHDYSSPVILAIANGDLETLKFLHEKGEIPLDIQEKNTENPSLKGWSAPWVAVAFNQPKILDFLSSKKTNMDTRQDKNGETPLIHAISLNNKYLISKLLLAGADPDFSDSKGITPLLFTLALDLPDIAKILLSKGASIPPFLTEVEFKSRIKSEEMKRVIQQYAPNRFSFLDAFQANSPFSKNVNGSFINEDEHLVFTGSLFRIYPFNIPTSSNYNFSCSLNLPQLDDSGEFGIIFSSLANNKWLLSLDAKGHWNLKNNNKTIKSGRFKLTGDHIKFKIKKEKNQFEFKLDENTILTHSMSDIPGNYFGFQVENNFQNGPWIIEKYKLIAF